MKLWKFHHFFSVEYRKWFSPAFVLVDEKGLVREVTEDEQLVSYWNYEEKETVSGDFVPGLVNSHSHAFQYGMVGLAESIPHNTKNIDNFWSWREKMYDIALKVSPHALKTIATQLYAEMLRCGYSHVVEFQYLHKNLQGSSYEPSTTMGEMLILAAKEAGIGLTLVPVYYRQGGFGKEGLDKQRRFLFKNCEEYLDLIKSYQQLIKDENQIYLGLGVHSIRAACESDIQEICSHVSERPFHIHIAEQVKEIEDCVKYYGQRSIEWFLSNIVLPDNVNFVHGTHITKEEMNQVIQSNVNVVICPSTEGNLGDGFFPIADYIFNQGCWSIGSDSHISLNPFEELRWLDYGARLNEKKRNVLISNETDSFNCFSGNKSFISAFTGGCRAAGVSSLMKNQPLSGILVNHPLMESSSSNYKLSTLIYGLDTSAYQNVISYGKWVIQEGRHIKNDEFTSQFKECVQELRFQEK